MSYYGRKPLLPAEHKRSNNAKKVKNDQGFPSKSRAGLLQQPSVTERRRKKKAKDAVSVALTGGRKKKPTALPHQLSSRILAKMRQHFLPSQRRDDRSFRGAKEEVGSAVRKANGLLNGLSSQSARPYLNPMFDFYRREAALPAISPANRPAAMLRRSRAAVAGNGGGNSLTSLSSLSVPLGAVQSKRPALYAEASSRRFENAEQVIRSDRALDALQQEITATVADCQKTVALLNQLHVGAALPRRQPFTDNRSSLPAMLPYYESAKGHEVFLQPTAPLSSGLTNSIQSRNRTGSHRQLLSPTQSTQAASLQLYPSNQEQPDRVSLGQSEAITQPESSAQSVDGVLRMTKEEVESEQESENQDERSVLLEARQSLAQIEEHLLRLG